MEEGGPWMGGEWSVSDEARRRWHNQVLTRVYQTRFGYPNGNCYAAAVASITGLPLEEIDEACGNAAGWPEGWDVMRRFLSRHGWYVIYFSFSSDLHEPYDNRVIGFPFNYLLSGTSASGLGHVVVAYSGRVVHNTNPDPEARLVSVSGVEMVLPMTGCELPFGESQTNEQMAEVMRERRRRRSIPLNADANEGVD